MFLQKINSVFQHRDKFFVMLGIGICLITAAWFATAGRWGDWSPVTYYFDELADGFLAGQLSIQERPSPELLAMEDPYDWQARIAAGISGKWDLSLYNGQYYLYWGPVPALIAAAVKAVSPVRVSDSALTAFFYIGIIFFISLSLTRLRRQYFSSSPAWLLFPLILFAGLNAAMMWLINRPSVYETAIAGGQFFLMLGLLCLLNGLSSQKNNGWWLLAAGFSWGAAIGCRVNLLAPVGLFGLVFLVLIFKTRALHKRILLLICLAVPLLLTGAGLGCYNLARFGNILETGHRYQVTGPALPTDYSNIASVKYIFPNLYSYFIRPPLIILQEFPFAFIPFVQEDMWPFFIRLPEHYYYPEPVAGLMTITPALWLIGLPLAGGIRRFKYWLLDTPYPHSGQPPLLTAIWVLLGGGVLMTLLPLMIFIAPVLRYLADVLPLATLLMAMCLWWGLVFFSSQPGIRRTILCLAVILLAASILLGVFSGFTSGVTPFETRNYDLYHEIRRIFQ